MENTELLRHAREEIITLRRLNKEQSIRLTAIDDMLCVLHGKPGVKDGGGALSPDVVFELDKAIAATAPRGVPNGA